MRSGWQLEPRWHKPSPHRWSLSPHRASWHRGCPSPPCLQRTTQVNTQAQAPWIQKIKWVKIFLNCPCYIWNVKYMHFFEDINSWHCVFMLKWRFELWLFILLSSLRVSADECRHYCFTRSGITWRLVANQCVHMATAAGCFPATTTTANTTTTAAATT